MDKIKKLIAIIGHVSFFSEFAPEELEALVQKISHHRFNAGETIIQRGAPADCFFILLKGRVEAILSKDKATPNFVIEEGSSFGEMAIIDASPRSASCIAASNCVVLKVRSVALTDSDDLSIRYKLVVKLSQILAKRLRAMDDFIVQSTVAHQAKELNVLATFKSVAPELPRKEEVPAKPLASSLSSQDFVQESPPLILPVVEAGGQVTLESISEPFMDENPFTRPTGEAEEYDDRVKTQEEQDVLILKINHQTDRIAANIPNALVSMVCNKMFGYWTGGKLARVNPQNLWPVESFTPGTPRLIRALHMVVLCSDGEAAYQEAYLKLPFSHRVVGLSQIGCAGTFLGSDDVILRYFKGECLKKAIKFDMEMPIDRLWKRKKECIEFLTHTTEDVRDETLFLVFDDASGKNTRLVRENFPDHQIVTVVKGFGFNKDKPGTMFSMPEKLLEKQKFLMQKSAYKNQGFYVGETFILPDYSLFFEQSGGMKTTGAVFATIGLLARVGPYYSGVVWGSKGGAEGAVKAAKAMYGVKGAGNAEDIAAAINWADQGGEKPKDENPKSDTPKQT